MGEIKVKEFLNSQAKLVVQVESKIDQLIKEENILEEITRRNKD
jgi:hypothetical protein